MKIPALIAQATSAAKSGDAARAEDLFRQVLAKFPANRRAREGLAKLHRRTGGVQRLLELWQAGQVSEALSLSQKLPLDHPTVRDIRAAALRKLGQLDAALDIYTTALSADPKNAMLWLNAGVVLMDCHRLAEAADHLSQAVKLTKDPNHRLALAQCRFVQGYHHKTRDLCEEVLQISDLPTELVTRAQNLLGNALLYLGQTGAACAVLDTALSQAPSNPTILHSVGLAAAANGDTDLARMACLNALKTTPERCDIHLSLSSLIRYAPQDTHLAQMQALLNTDLPTEPEADLRFALFKACADLNDPAAAMEHLDRANALRRAALGYDPASDRALFNRLSQLHLPKLPSIAASPSPRPVFVVGLPRSGTTLTEKVLAGAPDVVAGGELPTVTQAAVPLLEACPEGIVPVDVLRDFAARIQGELADFAGPRQVLVDKMPLNFRWAELLLTALPEARIVWLERDPVELAFSIYRHSFAGKGNRFAYGVADIAAMMADARILRCRLANDWPDRLHVLYLHDLTNNPEPTIRQLVDFCGLEWSDDCLHPEARRSAILTVSAQQVRQSIRSDLSDKWACFHAHLGPLRAALRDHGFCG